MASGHAEPFSTPPSTVAPAGKVPPPQAGRAGDPALGLAALVGAVIPVAFLVAFVARLGVNAPYSDEWDLIPLLQRSAAHTLRLSDLWAQHNEHRSFFPQVILVELARFTRWNLRWEIVPNLIVAGLTFLLLVFLLRRTIRPYGRGIHLLAGVAFAWLFFSPIQWENWLLGWQVAWFLVSLAGVAAAAILSEWPGARPAWPAVALGVVAGVVASYSLASGLLVWPACGVIFLARRRLRSWLAAWLLAGAVTGAVYVIGYHKPAQTPPLSTFLRDPLHSVLFLLAYLGTPLWGRQKLAVVVGLCVLIAFAGAVAYLALREREALRKAVVWVALAAYALLGALMTDVARVGFGVAQATASRYTTSAMLFFLSTLALTLIVVATRRSRQLPEKRLAGVRALVAIVVLAGVARSYTVGVRGMDAEHDLLERGRTCMAGATASQHACLEELVHDNDFAWRLLQYLRQKGLAGLSEAPPDRAARRGRADGSRGPLSAQAPG